ncbi:efflux RND transporter periplasmic adaptor subunit [Paenibacillus sp. MAHUQ-46]|uniref:Efflux RND transporter periplasmic adaptor subunit n=2 Tax=Paenibacillus TaxID=44249 RepID=A0A934MTV2_9BACL|nr:efflux RND transporter periplasmic adaptor subunit [Paenibacillus roseus]
MYAMLVAAALAGTAVLSGCTPEAELSTEQQQEERQTPVQVEKVKQGSLTLQSEILGTAAPSTAVDVFPKMTGELVQLDVKKGDKVKKGQRLGRVKGDELQSQVELDEYALEIAQNQYKAIARSEHTTDIERDQAKIAIEQAKLRLRQSRSQLDNTSITTPFAGEIVNVNGEAGGFVTTGSPLFSIISIDPIKIMSQISASQMLVLQTKNEVEVEIPDLNKTYTAKVSYLSPLTNDSGFYTLEAKLANPEEKIKPGMVAKLVVNQERQKDALLVPTESIIEKNGQPYVYIVKDGRAAMKEIEVLESQSDLSAIAGELKAGDEVVTKGQMTLADGHKVKRIEGAQKP